MNDENVHREQEFQKWRTAHGQVSASADISNTAEGFSPAPLMHDTEETAA